MKVRYTYGGGVSQASGRQTVVERARKYLAKLPPAISGQHGHDAIFVAAVSLTNGFALDPDAALQLLREFNLRCVPVFSENELRHKIESACNTAHQKPRGYLLGGQAPQSAGSKFNSQPKSKTTLDPATECERYLSGFRFNEVGLDWASPVP